MKKQQRRTTIPLDRDATGRFLPLIIGIMVLLATLMLVGAVMLGEGLSNWRSGLDLKLTVQVMQLDERATPLAQRVEESLAVLRASPQVATAEPLSGEDMSRLLAPWLGQGELPADLPVPALIDVTLKQQGDIAVLQESLKGIAGVSLDDHGSWLRDVRRLAQLSIIAAYSMVVLIAGAAALILILLVRAGLNTHRDVVELLHLVGATDAFIARQFQRHMLWVSTQGAVLGGVVAAILLAIVSVLGQRIGYVSSIPWLAVPVIPLLFVLLAGMTSRRTARRLLSELP